MPAWHITHNSHTDTHDVHETTTGKLRGQHPNREAAEDQVRALELSVPEVHRHSDARTV